MSHVGDADTLRRLSHLAALQVTPEESERLAGDLVRMLEAVASLHEADAHAEQRSTASLRLRPDAPEPHPT